MIPVDGESRAASQFSAGSSAVKKLHVVDAIGFGVGPDRLQLFGFLRRRRDDQLAAIAVRDAVLAAISVERALAADAHLRHQAAGPVIDAGMDYFAVARRGHRADAFGRLQHDHFAARLGEMPRDRKPDHPGSNDDAINLVHVRFKSGNRGSVQATAALRLLSFRSGVCANNPLDCLDIRPEAGPVSEALIMSGQLP
jgi:hypothetical protein